LRTSEYKKSVCWDRYATYFEKHSVECRHSLFHALIGHANVHSMLETFANIQFQTVDGCRHTAFGVIITGF